MPEKKVLMEAKNLVKEFPVTSGSKKAVVHAVSDVSLQIYEGETLALVGRIQAAAKVPWAAAAGAYRPDLGRGAL